MPSGIEHDGHSQCEERHQPYLDARRLPQKRKEGPPARRNEHMMRNNSARLFPGHEESLLLQMWRLWLPKKRYGDRTMGAP
jgi:hypothetical protein